MFDAKRKALIFLAIAFILAIITANAIITRLGEVEASLGEQITVAIAKEDITTYTIITPELLDWIQVPRGKHVESSLVLSEMDISNMIAIINIRKGELVTQNMLRNASQLPPDERVVWLNATPNVLFDQAVAVGDLVDIIITYEIEDDIFTSREFLQVRVVSVEPNTVNPDIPFVKVALPIQDAVQLIDFQHTATHIRVLLSTQVQQGNQLKEE